MGGKHTIPLSDGRTDGGYMGQAGSYNTLDGLGTQSISLFILGGTNSAWTVMDPDIYAPVGAELTAASLFN